MSALVKKDRLQGGDTARSRISREIESLRAKIADLEILELELTQAEMATSTKGPRPLRSEAASPKAEIERRFGYLPQFFAPALEFPLVLENLWRQTLTSYLDNPIPEMLKEKLFAVLSRYSASPYFLVVHSCRMHSLGMAPGEILRLLERPTPSDESEIRELKSSLAAAPDSGTWPEDGSSLEESLLAGSILSFLGRPEAEECDSGIRRILGPENYGRLVIFLAYVKTSHLWAEAHAEISFSLDPRIRSAMASLLRKEPHMAPLFHHYRRRFRQDQRREQLEEALRASEERYHELFEAANDIVYTLDLDGDITSINKAAERITGYTRAEALRMKLADLVAPECREAYGRAFDDQLEGNTATYEIEIVGRNGRRAALEINTHNIYRDGRVAGVQGIARDVTERKKTEETLRQTKQNLEEWVRELEQRTREMTLLSEMADMLRACLTMEEAYSVIARVATQIFPVQSGGLYVISHARNVVEAAAVWGDSSRVERVFALDECWALRRGRVHWVEDTRTGLLCRHLHHPPPEGYLCVPMMAQSEALGVLHLTVPAGGALTDPKLRLAMAMAEHIAMALSNLKLHETLRSQSIRDPLTGLFNRRFMEESLDLELRRAVRNQRPLGVIMVDLDRFKHFNDSFGHDAGDALLRELGSLLQSNIRGEDIACRYGGEEFTLILPEGSAEVTLQRAEALREAIKRLDVVHRGQPLGRITASLGVAVFPKNGRTGETLLKAADAALYLSKDAGGDHVTSAR